MNIVCAKCGAGVAYELSSLATQTVVVCSACGSGLKVSIEPIAVPGGSVPSAPVSITPARRPAVVAVQGEATRELIGELLTSAGFTVTEVATGSETLAKVGALRPVLVLVDVGFSDMPGFQVCEALRRDAGNAGVTIILVAAIHNKDRYRRPPDKLYGADDYIERHRIESELIDKVNRLCGGSSADEAPARAHAQGEMPAPSYSPEQPASPSESPAAGEIGAVAGVASAQPTTLQPSRPSAPPVPERVQPGLPAQASERVEPRPPDATPPAKDAPAAPVPPAPANPAQEAALRLARIIVSDIALYNAKKVDEGVINGTFFDLLRTEIEEGRKLYEERKGPGLATTVDLFRQTLDQFVATRRELLKRSRPAAA
jgi:CheY-like chemotaxis protein